MNKVANKTDQKMEKSEGFAARAVALSLLDDVLQRRQALDHALEQSASFKGLTVRDRAFVRMLVSTTLRRLGQVDDLLGKAVQKGLPANITLLNILRLGVVQILFMEVADHAAVDLSVRLTEKQGLERQKGFVNGVLRTMTRVGREWVERQDAGRLNAPEWLLKLWIEDYDLGVAAQIARAHLAEAPLDITIKDESARNFWASNLKATQMTTGTLRRIAGGAVHELSGFDEGHWWVQDASAALPVQLLGDVRGQVVYDLCAAPGGKTLQLAAFGARVVALDRSAKRLERLKANLERMGLAAGVDVQALDAVSWTPPEPAAFILLDAPCSATGTARRHPDVLHLKVPADLESLQKIQVDILENAFAQLMVGGVLVYCVCSLQKSEGEVQIEAFLARHSDAKRLPVVADELGGFDEPLTPEGDVRVLPFHHAALGGMDGFYMSRITKLL